MGYATSELIIVGTLLFAAGFLCGLIFRAIDRIIDKEEEE